MITIISKSGSSPRGTGSKMFIDKDGNSYGSIGGGNVEFQALKYAPEAQHGEIRKYNLSNQGGANLGMICGGEVECLGGRIDLVGSYTTDLGPGQFGLTLAWNYNITEVDAGTSSVVTNPDQKRIFEERLPGTKGSLSATYAVGGWDLVGRMRYYGPWTDSSGNADGEIFQRFGAMYLFDLSVGYTFNQRHSLRIGADNLFNRYPDEATFQASRGLVYSRNAPYDTDGSNIYLQYSLRL